MLAPTRELATQIDATIAPLAKVLGLNTTVIFGGVSQGRQVSALNGGVDIVIACPGRLEDLLNQKALTLDDVQITVLDEADHMADLGFLPVVKRIMDKTPKARPAPAVLGHPGQGRRPAGQAVPDLARSSTPWTAPSPRSPP